MNSQIKILTDEQLIRWSDRAKKDGKQLIATNGCFDILHVGHVVYLEEARSLGDVLIVGINSDDSVRRIKGPKRPVNSEHDRAAVLAALQCVDVVYIFSDNKATNFLRLCRPDVYAKGGDYSPDGDYEEIDYMKETGRQSVFLSVVPNKSTTGLIEKMTNLREA